MFRVRIIRSFTRASGIQIGYQFQINIRYPTSATTLATIGFEPHFCFHKKTLVSEKGIPKKPY